DVAPHCPNLADLLRRPTPGGVPLLVASFSFFLRRQVETNAELSRGLTFEGLRQLSAAQADAFGELDRALGELGGRFDEVIGQLRRLEAVAVVTHAAVQDLRTELEKLARSQADATGELRKLVEDALSRMGRRDAVPEGLTEALETYTTRHRRP